MEMSKIFDEIFIFFFEGNIQKRYFQEEKMKISRKNSHLQGDKFEVEVNITKNR